MLENPSMKKRNKEDRFVRYILFYQKLYRKGFKRCAKFLYWIYRMVFGIDIPCTVKIGKCLRLPHYGLGVVVHPAAVIGDHVTTYQQVTVGARDREWNTVIGNYVLIGAGAKILGSVSIGDNSKIGANAVVLDSVPENATVVGIPAKVVAVDNLPCE